MESIVNEGTPLAAFLEGKELSNYERVSILTIHR